MWSMWAATPLMSFTIVIDTTRLAYYVVQISRAAMHSRYESTSHLTLTSLQIDPSRFFYIVAGQVLLTHAKSL